MNTMICERFDIGDFSFTKENSVFLVPENPRKLRTNRKEEYKIKFGIAYTYRYIYDIYRGRDIWLRTFINNCEEFRKNNVLPILPIINYYNINPYIIIKHEPINNGEIKYDLKVLLSIFSLLQFLLKYNYGFFMLKQIKTLLVKDQHENIMFYNWKDFKQGANIRKELKLLLEGSPFDFTINNLIKKY